MIDKKRFKTDTDLDILVVELNNNMLDEARPYLYQFPLLVQKRLLENAGNLGHFSARAIYVDDYTIIAIDYFIYASTLKNKNNNTEKEENSDSLNEETNYIMKVFHVRELEDGTISPEEVYFCPPKVFENLINEDHYNSLFDDEINDEVM